ALVGVDNAFAHQIFARDAHMHDTASKLRSDLARGKIGNLDTIEARDRAAIFADAAWFRQGKASAREKGFRVFLQSAFGGNSKDKGRGHDRLPWASPHFASVSTQTENPTAGIGEEEPSRCNSPS